MSAPELFRRRKLKPLYASWWLVSNRRRKVTGILESDEQGHLTLTLNGVLARDARSKSLEAALDGQHRLAGANSIGAWATLENCFVRYADTLAKPSRQIWHVGQALLGSSLRYDHGSVCVQMMETVSVWLVHMEETKVG